MTESESIFFDTNILVYARDRAEAVKGSIAQQLSNELMNAGRVIVSVQVLSEFFSAATKKSRPCLTVQEAAHDVLQILELCDVVSLTPEVLELAVELVQTHQLTIWDAQIVAAASLAGAGILLTEDMQDRPVILGVRYVNPFEPGFDWRQLLS